MDRADLRSRGPSSIPLAVVVSELFLRFHSQDCEPSEKSREACPGSDSSVCSTSCPSRSAHPTGRPRPKKTRMVAHSVSNGHYRNSERHFQISAASDSAEAVFSVAGGLLDLLCQ